MARAANRGQAVAGQPIRSARIDRELRPIRVAGPQPIGDFLPRLQTHVRWIPVRVWRDGSWQQAWISQELVHVANCLEPRARRFAWRDHA